MKSGIINLAKELEELSLKQRFVFEAICEFVSHSRKSFYDNLDGFYIYKGQQESFPPIWDGSLLYEYLAPSESIESNELRCFREILDDNVISYDEVFKRLKTRLISNKNAKRLFIASAWSKKHELKQHLLECLRIRKGKEFTIFALNNEYNAHIEQTVEDILDEEFDEFKNLSVCLLPNREPIEDKVNIELASFQQFKELVRVQLEFILDSGLRKVKIKAIKNRSACIVECLLDLRSLKRCIHFHLYEIFTASGQWFVKNSEGEFQRNTQGKLIPVTKQWDDIFAEAAEHAQVPWEADRLIESLNTSAKGMELFKSFSKGNGSTDMALACYYWLHTFNKDIDAGEFPFKKYAHEIDQIFFGKPVEEMLFPMDKAQPRLAARKIDNARSKRFVAEYLKALENDEPLKWLFWLICFAASSQNNENARIKELIEVKEKHFKHYKFNAFIEHTPTALSRTIHRANLKRFIYEISCFKQESFDRQIEVSGHKDYNYWKNLATKNGIGFIPVQVMFCVSAALNKGGLKAHITRFLDEFRDHHHWTQDVPEISGIVNQYLPKIEGSDDKDKDDIGKQKKLTSSNIMKKFSFTDYWDTLSPICQKIIKHIAILVNTTAKIELNNNRYENNFTWGGADFLAYIKPRGKDAEIEFKDAIKEITGRDYQSLAKVSSAGTGYDAAKKSFCYSAFLYEELLGLSMEQFIVGFYNYTCKYPSHIIFDGFEDDFEALKNSSFK